MKKIYNSPSIEVTRFDAEDIILTSLTQAIVVPKVQEVLGGGTEVETHVVIYGEDNSADFNW